MSNTSCAQIKYPIIIQQKQNSNNLECRFLYISPDQTSGLPQEKVYNLYRLNGSTAPPNTNFFPIVSHKDTDLIYNTTQYELTTTSSIQSKGEYTLKDNDNCIANSVNLTDKTIIYYNLWAYLGTGTPPSTPPMTIASTSSGTKNSSNDQDMISLYDFFDTF